MPWLRHSRLSLDTFKMYAMYAMCSRFARTGAQPIFQLYKADTPCPHVLLKMTLLCLHIRYHIDRMALHGVGTACPRLSGCPFNYNPHPYRLTSGCQTTRAPPAVNHARRRPSFQAAQSNDAVDAAASCPSSVVPGVDVSGPFPQAAGALVLVSLVTAVAGGRPGAVAAHEVDVAAALAAPAYVCMEGAAYARRREVWGVALLGMAAGVGCSQGVGAWLGSEASGVVRRGVGAMNVMYRARGREPRALLLR